MKKAWVERYITDSDDHFSRRILASAVYNYMSHASIINCLMHFAKRNDKDERGFLPGLLKSLSKLNRDQMAYFRFFGLIIDLLKNKPGQKFAATMVQEFVAIEQQILEDLFKLCGGSVKLGDMDLDLNSLKKRLFYQADLCMSELGFTPSFKVKDPLSWIEMMIILEHKKDDMEHGVYEGPKAQVEVKQKPVADKVVFSLDEDF
jgi:ribonucleotide reductase beta subunit family protein with ferritin-like domain